jgi:hypothetical protein
VHLNLHHEWLGNSTFVGVGARSIPYLQEKGDCAEVVVGRPLRLDGEKLPCPNRESGQSGSQVPRARAWQKQARGELESVPAFVNLAVQLLHLGAPDELVDRALTAAEEELAHARTCLELARKADATALVPTLPSNWSRRPLEGEAGFESLAVEAWLDGIVNEGASALMSECGLSTVGDKGARPALLQLVREEWGHFELAQDSAAGLG